MTWPEIRQQVEDLADALAPRFEAEDALMIAEWIVQNPEAAVQAAFDHYLNSEEDPE